MVRLAQKAFHPGPIPFPLLHVDTTYKFQEMIEFRDRFCAEIGVQPDRPHQSPGDRRRRQPLPPGHAEVLRPAQDARPARRPQRRRLRRGLRRRAARRREIARQGARLLLPRRLRPVGPQESAPRTVEPLQQPHRQGREHPRLPALQLDRTGRLALHPPGEHPHRAALLRQTAAHGGARRSADPGGARHAAAARRRAADGDVPHALAGLHATAPAPSAPRPTRCPRSSKR